MMYVFNAWQRKNQKAYTPKKPDMEIKGLVKSRVLSQVQNYQIFSNDISLHELVIARDYTWALL